MLRSHRARFSCYENIRQPVRPTPLPFRLANLIVANLDHDRRQAAWARMTLDRVIDLIGRSIRLIDADGERGIGLQSANEIIGQPAILAEYGHCVLVLEREKFPRYHIGESLIPFTYQPLERLGLEMPGLQLAA